MQFICFDNLLQSYELRLFQRLLVAIQIFPPNLSVQNPILNSMIKSVNLNLIPGFTSVFIEVQVMIKNDITGNVTINKSGQL